MGEYEVERVIGRKNGVNGREYQVKWRGYPLSESTWEPENNLKTCKDLIQDYDRKIDEASKRLKVSPIESKSKSNTVWKTPVKTIKASQPKIRKVSKKTDNQ